MKRNLLLVLLIIGTIADVDGPRFWRWLARWRHAAIAGALSALVDSYGGDGIYGTGEVPREENFWGIFNPGALCLVLRIQAARGFDAPQKHFQAYASGQSGNAMAPPQVNPYARTRMRSHAKRPA